MYNNEFKNSVRNQLVDEISHEKFSWKSVLMALELLGLDM